jgi:hypothetical protein
MIKRNIIITLFIIFCLLPLAAQEKKQDAVVKREVTLYNPYKPSLPEAKKRSFLPDMSDTVKIRPTFRYDINTVPFMPAYTISPIKAASLLPDPLPKLYKSFIRLGMGNYLTPLAEISITNERSKKGSIGFYGRHFSSNGKIELDNGKKVFAGYMDNDASLFGRRFFRNSVFEGSVDLIQKTRYAYGYDPRISDYSPSKKDTRIGYSNIGAKASLSSSTLDSANFSYRFDLRYNYFYNTRNLNQHNFGFNGIMARSFNGFFIGSGIGYDYYRLPDLLLPNPKYVASISPFFKKSSDLWNFKLGIQALLDRNMTSTAVAHVYPDMNFGFSIVPSYLGFFASLSGKLERNDPLKIISENPYLPSDGTLFTLPNTSHDLIVATGLKGNNGIGGNYILSASYSLISDMLFYSNMLYSNGIFPPGRGNLFAPLKDDANLLNLHAEMSGTINEKVSFNVGGNYNKYSLSSLAHAWNKPDWDAKLGFKYNLRDKIIAGIDLSAEGKRWEIVNGDLSMPVLYAVPVIFEMPVHFNLNLNAEYRYSKILSFWAKFNNISTKPYYEWAYYPTQRFLMMFGFTYSL